MPLSLSLFLLPFSFVNPPLLPVIIYPYVSQLFSLLLFPFHPIYFLLYLNFTRLCSSLFLLVIFLFLFLIISPSITLYAPHSLFFFSVVSPRRLTFFCSTVYFSSSTSFKYYQFVLFFMSKEFLRFNIFIFKTFPLYKWN